MCHLWLEYALDGITCIENRKPLSTAYSNWLQTPTIIIYMCNGTTIVERLIPLFDFCWHLLNAISSCGAPTWGRCHFNFQNSYVSHFNCFAYSRSEEKPWAFRFLLVFDKSVIGIVNCGGNFNLFSARNALKY